MSYILDALRRSDAEREREQAQVPNLFAQQPAGAGLRPAESERRPMPGWAWVAIGVGLGVAVPAVWFGLMRPSPVVAVAPTAPSDRGVVSAPPPVVAPPPAAARTAPPAMPQAPAVVAAPIEQISAPPAPKPKAVAPPTRAPRETSVARSTDAARTTAPQASAAEPAKAERVPRLNELPDSVRRELPTLAFGGAVYSETPSARFVILNGLVHREQDRIAPELVVEQIKLKSAVLRYRDQRFEIAF
jgi:general secretion pathway protein B